jgi:hypothetical protein
VHAAKQRRIFILYPEPMTKQVMDSWMDQPNWKRLDVISAALSIQVALSKQEGVLRIPGLYILSVPNRSPYDVERAVAMTREKSMPEVGPPLVDVLKAALPWDRSRESDPGREPR